MKILKKLGFTLVELVITVVIIGILASVAFLNYQGYSGDARDTVRIRDLQDIEKALSFFEIKTGKFPLPEFEDGIQKIEDVNGDGVNWYVGKFGEEQRQKLPQLTKTFLDPKPKKAYDYYVTEDLAFYKLVAKEVETMDKIERTNYRKITDLAVNNSESTPRCGSQTEDLFNGACVPKSIPVNTTCSVPNYTYNPDTNRCEANNCSVDGGNGTCRYDKRGEKQVTCNNGYSYNDTTGTCKKQSLYSNPVSTTCNRDAGNRFTLNSQTILDTITGLYWEKTPTTSTRTWQNAKNHCADLNKGGFTDWRLPDISELRSIVNYSCYNTATYDGFKINSLNYWSSTTYYQTDKALVIFFKYGSDGKEEKNNNKIYFLCVR